MPRRGRRRRHETRVIQADSQPVQIGPNQSVIFTSMAVYLAVEDDIKKLVELLTGGYEYLGGMPWGEMSIAFVRRAKPAPPVKIEVPTKPNIIKPRG